MTPKFSLGEQDCGISKIVNDIHRIARPEDKAASERESLRDEGESTAEL